MRRCASESLDLIYANCEPDGGCQLWLGAMTSGPGPTYPIACARDPSRASGQRLVHVRRRVFELTRGRPAKPVPKYVVIAKCGNDRCVAEECLQEISKSERLRQAARAGAFQSNAFRAKVAAGKRRSSRLSDQDVAELRTSNEPVPALAARLSISVGYAYAVRAGRMRRDFSSPFAALVPVLHPAAP